MSKSEKVQSAAVLTIRHAPGMTPKGRRDIARWLHKQADMLLAEGKNYTKGRYTARYLHR